MPKEEKPQEGKETPEEGGKKEEQAKPEEKKQEEKQEEKKEEIQYEIKFIQKSDRSRVKYDFQEHGLDDQTLVICKEAEEKLYKIDEEIIQTKMFKNDLEAYVYDMRNKVGEGKYVPYIDESSAASYI